MRNKNILIFGSTGFIGRSLVKRVKRNILSGDIGQIEVVDFELHNLSNLEELIKKSDYVINLVGLLF